MAKPRKKIYYHQGINDWICQKACQEPVFLEGIKKHQSTVGGTLDALESLGYEVCLDCRTSFLFHQGIFYSNKIFSFFRKAYKKIFRKIDNWLLNWSLRKKIGCFSPDYFYTELNPVVSKKTLDFMRSKNVQCIEWFGIFPSSFEKTDIPIQTVSSYNVIVSPKNFLGHFEETHKPQKFIEVHAAYNPKVYKKKEVGQYIHDVVFVGGVANIHSNRWDFLEALFERYDGFAFYGYGVESVPPKYSFVDKYKGDVWSYAYTDVLNQSKIAVNLMLDSYHELSSGVNQRTFEIAACGAFQLCEHTDNLKKFFVLGEDVETFKNVEEMFKKIDYYLDNEDERKKIALNGHEKARPYNYYNQMKYVFENV